MTTVSHGKPYAGNPHVRFEEGDSASAEPRRKSLLHKHRNVVYFFDGTTQCRSKDEYSDWSNIVRLHGLLSRTAPDGTEQWSNYADGVGCRVNEKILGSSAGVGLEKRVEEAYLHLGTMVRDAKRLGLELRVYLFGFSRGAYAARWFAALVDMCGVPSNGVSAREAFRRFEAGDREAAKRAIGAGTFLPPPQIEMMGLFDTVKATLFDSDFDLAKRPGIVKKVCHAMSYHEKRSLFPVSRFDPDPGHVEEVWFTGSHTDVGGGYVVRGLADMTLAWMIENARECGLSFADGPIPDDTAVHEVRYNDSSSFFWSVAGLFTKGAVHAERESEVGDVFHWQVHGLRDMFVDVEPALPPEDMIVYSRPMNPGVMMA